jgi:NAD(P)-dependent dehydrogenase (short-subunit alcohol dehydrogenase family)
MVSKHQPGGKVNGPDGMIAMVTGANAGIGKDVARQLALSGRRRKIILACRNPEKANAAKAELEASTGRAIFEIVTVDVSDPKSVQRALGSLKAPLDDLVMNAGGAGGRTPLALTSAGVTQIFATNVLGHVQLLEGLVASGMLKHAAVFAGSEAARGVPKLGMKRPVLETGAVEEFASFCDGSYFRSHRPDTGLAYSQVKLVGALWMASLARRHPRLRLLTVSPGNTSGTEVARDFPPVTRAIMKFILAPMVMPLFGIVHDLDKGAQRLVDGLSDATLNSGGFYASRADALTGPLVDQSTIFPALADATFQDNANAAVHRFLKT